MPAGPLRQDGGADLAPLTSLRALERALHLDQHRSRFGSFASEALRRSALKTPLSCRSTCCLRLSRRTAALFPAPLSRVEGEAGGWADLILLYSAWLDGSRIHECWCWLHFAPTAAQAVVHARLLGLTSKFLLEEG